MSNTLPPGPLSYTGEAAVPLITKTFAPTTSNYQFAVPTIWVDTSVGNAYILVQKPNNVANWVLMASNSGDISEIDTPDGNVVVPTLGVVDFLDGTGMTITGSGNAVTFNASGGGFTWNTVTTTTQPLVANNAYIANNASLITFTLPSTAAVGDSYAIVGYGAGGWALAQNILQSTILGKLTTTTGISGSLASTIASNLVFITCTVADTVFKVIDSGGNITVV